MGAEEVVRVLAVSPAEEDHRALGHVFSHSKWRIDTAHTCGEAREFLRHQPVPVIICSSDLPDGNWKTVLADTSLTPTPARVIVASQLADDALWGEVLDRGGYDVLGKPFDAGEVVRVVSLAWRQWKHESEQIARQEPRSVRHQDVRKVGGHLTGPGH